MLFLVWWNCSAFQSFSAFTLPEAKVKLLNDGEKEFMLMTRNLDPVQNFKQILLNSCPNNEITKNRLKNYLNLTSPQQNQGRGKSNTVSSPHSVNFNMIYEQNGAAPAVNCPTASNFQLKDFFFFDCNGLEEDHKAAKLIFHGHMMLQGRQSPQKKHTSDQWCIVNGYWSAAHWPLSGCTWWPAWAGWGSCAPPAGPSCPRDPRWTCGWGSLPAPGNSEPAPASPSRTSCTAWPAPRSHSWGRGADTNLEIPICSRLWSERRRGT